MNGSYERYECFPYDMAYVIEEILLTYLIDTARKRDVLPSAGAVVVFPQAGLRAEDTRSLIPSSFPVFYTKSSIEIEARGSQRHIPTTSNKAGTVTEGAAKSPPKERKKKRNEKKK